MAKKMNGSTTTTPANPPQPPTTVSAARSRPVDGRSYNGTVSIELSMPQRCAQYFDDCARRYPYQLIRYDEIYRNVNMLRKRGTVAEIDIKRTRAHVRAANRYLAKYGRHIVLGELGARASVDDQDVAESVAPKKMGRIVSSIKAAQEMDAIVNTKNLESDEMGTWYRKSFKPALAALEKVRDGLLEASPETHAALPPKSSTH